MPAPADPLAVLDWRRRTRDAYARVREVAAEDPAAAHALWVAERDDLALHHPASPLDAAARAHGRGLPVAPYDPALRFVAPLLPAEPHRLEVTTGTDGVVPFERVGAVELDGVGRLDAWWLASYGGGLFVPVRDASAGRPGGTFGGGRYVLDTVKGADLGSVGDALVVDLNFAYNPSCAYDPSWACPLAPPGNRVEADLSGAGELAGPWLDLSPR